MEHAAVWLKEMEEVPKETEPGIITEIRKKDDPRVKVEWNKPTKNSETIKANTEEKRKAQEWRVIKCYRCDAPGHIASSRTCAARNAICRTCGQEDEEVLDVEECGGPPPFSEKLEAVSEE
ncbi:hypothetical protein NDU88_002769 [Pleurodeles waltl]|uniref:CCHC-type domain-containing protein n=1 Tax=Pleurodeles waltl TaxID=8319 RepID=A0AAV7MSM3_PLEWA|nr:hypothetical protein NDU88_002769 [Pleurodeles waltl]